MNEQAGIASIAMQSMLAGMEVWKWLALLGGTLVAWLAAVALGTLLFKLAKRVTKRTSVEWDDALLDTVTPPGKLLLATAFVSALSQALQPPVSVQTSVAALLRTAGVLILTWLGLRFVKFVAESIETRATSGEKDPARVRGLRTQVQVLQRVAFVVVAFFGVALVLMQFDVVRTVGTSLLASAGIAGIVVGLAAQRSISTLLAGIQLSITQPVRMGDVVIIENEWGVIEEITLTYVVVRIWDQRRLVVPITKFLETSFQNWTKVEAAIMGTAFISVDFTVSVDVVRAELQRIVQASPRWDGRVCGLQVTDATDRVVTLRALVSAADAGKCFDLRCEVREGLLQFLQQYEGGRYLPRTRVQPLTDETPSTASLAA